MAIVLLAVAAFGPNGWRPAIEWRRRETPEPWRPRFFLEEDEAQAANRMRQWRLRYVAFDAQRAGPLYPAHFLFLRDQTVEGYLLQGWKKTPEGTMQWRRFYRPAYYRSMAARLGRGRRGAGGDARHGGDVNGDPGV
jgi:hypothetical protein